MRGLIPSVVNDKLRWMSDMRNGKNASLSAGATEFVPSTPGGQFPGFATKAAAYVPLSPGAAEFQPEGGRQWGWNGSQWGADGAWAGPQDWTGGPGYYSGSGNARWPGMGSPTCWFNDDAYSTDSSRSSDSEPEVEEATAGPKTLPSQVPMRTEKLEAEAPKHDVDLVDDDDEFNSFSEEEDELQNLPADAENTGSTVDGAAASELAKLRNKDEDGGSGEAAPLAAEEADVGHESKSEADLRSPVEEELRSLPVSVDEAPGSESCKYTIGFMLTMRRVVARAEPASSTVLPQCKQVGSDEDVPDFLRRREESEQNGEEKWRAARSGDASKNRVQTGAQDAKQSRSDKGAKEVDLAPPKLEVSESSWAAQIAKRKALSKESSDDTFVKNMRSILNKLTVEKFDTLSDQIIDLVSQSDRPNHGIPLLMQLVFEKATTQHHFINMYVGLCVKLQKWLTENERIEAAESQSNFKRVLLNQCQSSFEQYLEPPEGFEGLTGDDLYEAQVKYKTKMLGNIRLVGELIRHGMLAPKIAIAVASELARDDPAVRSERLETLATFLETVGVALDNPSWKHHDELELVFEEVVRACSDQTIPRRVRCLLQDVLDLRNGGWKSKRRKDISKETPQTLAQVHEKAKADQVSKKDTGPVEQRSPLLLLGRALGTWGGNHSQLSACCR